MRRLLLTALPTLLALAALVPPAAASPRQEAMFQDDKRLVYAKPDEVAETLNELRRLGVDRVRITVVWRAIAPDPESDRRPDFDATNPDAYPRGRWDNYDTVLRLAQERGIGVNFNLTAPAPDWATGSPEREDIDDVYTPSPEEFGRFVRAVATRYDGAHGPARVDYWSLYNEPNQAAWLSPQWVRRDGAWVEAAPRLYRRLAGAGWTALQETGHGGDTILVGDTAPKGLRFHRGETRSIDALRFIRRLYCVDDNNQLLRGAAAERHDCPTGDQVARFPAENPALFRATGFAHHPYELLFAPSRRPAWRDWATMGNLPALQLLLRRLHLRYAQPLRGQVPLYLTEFGYQTNPPDRFGVTKADQAAYLNHAEYIAYRNPDVRTLSQFLLVDDGPPVERTFQSGLRVLAGGLKPAYRAYRMGIHLPSRRVRRGRSLRVWGIARPAPDGARPEYTIEFRRRGSKRWRRIATRRGLDDKGYLDTRIRVRRSGSVRLRWNEYVTRAVGVRVVAKRRR